MALISFLNKVLTQGGKPAVAAIEALGKIGGEDALTALIAQLGGDNFQEALNALLSFKGDISGKVTEALKVTTGQQQNRLLALASFRRITSAAPVVFDLAVFVHRRVLAARDQGPRPHHGLSHKRALAYEIFSGERAFVRYSKLVHQTGVAYAQAGPFSSEK